MKHHVNRYRPGLYRFSLPVATEPAFELTVSLRDHGSTAAWTCEQAALESWECNTQAAWLAAQAQYAQSCLLARGSSGKYTLIHSSRVLFEVRPRLLQTTKPLSGRMDGASDRVSTLACSVEMAPKSKSAGAAK